jgi:hypothetical protein
MPGARMAIDPRARALLLLALSFVVGGFTGVALDRRVSRPDRALGRRTPTAANDSANLDRIPVPLEQLGLTAEETGRLREIARRWRPQALVALGEFRQRVNVLEDGMFAEMLCVLSPEKRDRYVAGLRGSHYDESLIARRLELVSAHRCSASAQP